MPTTLGTAIKNGFKACGIVPFDPQHMLEKLPDVLPPGNNEDVAQYLEVSLRSILPKIREKPQSTT